MKKRIVIWMFATALGAVTLCALLPQATVTAPNGGEKLLLGAANYLITWKCSNCTADKNLVVEIYNTLHSGPGWSGQISPAGVPMNQGYYKWLVVGKLKDGTFLKPGAGYKIHLEAIDGSDASNQPFAIVKMILLKKDIH